MRKVLSSKINQVFNDSFTNKEIRDIFEPDDFETIFIVEDDQTNRKLLQCTVRLSNKIAYCPEILTEQVIQIVPRSAEPAKEPEKVATEAPSTNGQAKEATNEEVKDDMNEEIEDKPKEEAAKNDDAMNEEVAEPAKEPESGMNEETKENVAEEEKKLNKKGSRSKSAKKTAEKKTTEKAPVEKKPSTTRKPKKEIIHQSPKPVTDLENEEGAGVI